MPIGLVTNCWQIQLASGESVEELVEQASRRGYRAIELRHGALGEFESGESRFPNASMLSRLPVRFPEVRFNVAIPFPFLAEAAKPTDPLFQAGLWAADAVKGCFPPHLRLVDLTTDLFEANPSVAAPPETLVSLTEALESIDGLLSIENARQPWRSFSAAFFEARRRLGRDR